MSKKRVEITDDQKNIILEIFKSGMKPGKIVKELSINCSTTYKFSKRYNESGTIKNKKRSGRSPRWTTRDSNRLSKLLKVHKKANLRYIWQLFNQNRDNTVSLSTIRRKVRALMVRRCIKKFETVCRKNRVK